MVFKMIFKSITALALTLLALFTLAINDCCPPNNRQARYLAFGDSATAGADQPTYPQWLAELLQLSEQEVVNLGDSGEKAADGLPRLNEIMDCDSYPHAEYLLYWEGGNDLIDFVQSVDPALRFSPNDLRYPYSQELDATLQSIVATQQAAITLAREHGLTPLIATYYQLLPHISPCSLTPLDELTEGQVENANDYNELFAGQIRQMAGQEGIGVADILSESGALLDDPANFANCNHASGAGNKIIADIWLAALNSMAYK
jgi:lysophospholipase L1-like esterase